MTLKLEVGKRYVRRDGAVSEVVREDVINDSGKSRFIVTLNTRSIILYGEDGSFWSDKRPDNNDLVDEYIEPTATEFQQLSRIVEIFDGMSAISKRDVLAFLNSRFGER